MKKKMVFYRFIWKFCRAFLRLYNGAEFIFEGQSPKKGPLMVIANHSSYYDPVLVGVAFWRPVIFLAKEELFKVWIMRKFLQGMHSKSVKRTVSDIAGTRRALQVLKKKRALGMFPEGTRTQDGIFNPDLIKPGFVKIAEKRNAWVQAVGISGSFDAFPKSSWFPGPDKIVLCVNKPIKISTLKERLLQEGEESITADRIREYFCAEIQRLCLKADKIKLRQPRFFSKKRG